MIVLRGLVLSFYLSAVVAGCGGGGTARYIPATGTAKRAVQTALDAWKTGAKYEPLTASKPQITVFDSRWQAGTKLESFEVLEEIPGQEQPQFKVRQKLAGQPEETVTYLVVGIDPLHVFRDADYKRATGL